MTFWQGLVIGFLANRTSIAGDTDAEDDKDMWGKQAQNFLICLEMLLFSIAHFFCFPTEEWQEGYRPAAEKKLKMMDNMAFGDFVSDLKLIMRGNKERNRSSSGKKYQDIEKGSESNEIKSRVTIKSTASTQHHDEYAKLLENSHDGGKDKRRKNGKKKSSCVIS